ncbi:MAG: FdhF/YdeP family oxidoreductase [Pseudomonadota bacterium]
MTAIGGGFKKIGYTLATVRRVGIAKAGKALTSKNTCKACALGMGGQLGGMTNEAGEFPSVCNKSVQAQSTDIQPAIPEEVFTHPIDDFRELSPNALEHLGRLTTPLHKAKHSNQFRPMDWDEAIALAAKRLATTNPQNSFFYASGRSSNEAGFLLQLLARCYGTNHVNNCSYYCHQATGVGLARTIGTGTATIELDDLDKADLIFVIGANPASNHPRFIHRLKACRERGGKVIVINPMRESGLVRFAVPKSPRSLLAGGTDIASHYLSPNIGSDIALLSGLAKAVLENGADNSQFIASHCEHADEWRSHIESLDWSTLVSATGIDKATIEAVARVYAHSQNSVFAWGMGITHHLHGVLNVEAISNLALVRGMIGRPGAGLLPLRGHSNVQGIGTIGVKPVLAADVIERMQTHFDIDLPETPGFDTMSCMHAAMSGEINVALLMGGNLLSANPNQAWAERAMDRIGTRICLTTTLNRSHVAACDHSEMIILPVAARDEEWEPTTQESMFNFVRLSDGQIIRHANVRPEVVVLADIATALMPDIAIDFQAFKKHRYVRECIADIVPGMAAIRDIDVAKREFHIGQRLLHEPNFNTASGKAAMRIVEMPTVDRGQHNYTLATVRSEGQFNSIVYEENDSYRETATRWCVMMNAEDARSLGISEEDTVSLTSDHGEMHNVTVYVRDLPPGNLIAYYPEANALTGTAVDPLSQTPAFKNTPVSISH